jgi:16S rRNA G527 N7-methylase RsmG
MEKNKLRYHPRKHIDTRLQPLKDYLLSKEEFSYQDIMKEFNVSYELARLHTNTVIARSSMNDCLKIIKLADKRMKCIRLKDVA